VPPSTLLIDLDGVLRLWPKDDFALEQAQHLPAGSISRTAFDPVLLERAISGRITDQEWRSEVAKKLTASYPSSRAEHAVAAWSKPIGSVHYDVLRVVIQARRYCRVGLVTNATDRLPRDLVGLGLAEHLDFVVNSSDVGFAKPNAEIFRHALAIAGAQPAETLFVDDTLENVSAATELGIHAHHFTSSANFGKFMQAFGIDANAL
jgi:putative hydrolase of the HAD superfamily